MKHVALFVLLVPFFVFAQSDAEKETQKTQPKTTTATPDSLTVTITGVKFYLALPSDATGGKNGAGVAYDPARKLYYVAQAGNATFPFVVFDGTGNVVWNGETMVDVRGIWYNPKAKSIEANTYNNRGVVRYTINSKGIPVSYEIILDSLDSQPEENSCGVFDSQKDQILFLDYDYLMRYDAKSGEFVSDIHLDPDYQLDFDYMNSTSLIYTGKRGKEIGVFDYDAGIVDLFNMSTGKRTLEVILPYTSPEPDRLNFAYCNGLIWLFDTDARQWSGYKLP